MYKYLKDKPFLYKLFKLRNRSVQAEVVLLTYDEKPIRAIQGELSAGSISVNGSSAVRRTINLTMFANELNNDLENIENDISIEKKFKASIGLHNPFPQYKHYGTTVWFPLGIYLIATANLSVGTNGSNISITGKDKMVLLDGTVGGVLAASTTFHERQYEDEDGNIITEEIPMYEIIKEAVHHLGGEALDKMMIELPEYGKLLKTYRGSQSVYFDNNYTRLSYNRKSSSDIEIKPGENIGYEKTPLTYPGELVLNAGETIVNLLDKIKNVLNNYEYFYDVMGNFIFQQKKNFLNTASPLGDIKANDYVLTYSNTENQFSLVEANIETQITKNPKYDNIKNDFTVWGERELPSGAKRAIRYRLVIDRKPELYKCLMYMYAKKDSKGKIVGYEYFNTKEEGAAAGYSELFCPPAADWREEIYRNALEAEADGGYRYSVYDQELLVEWRKLFDPNQWPGGWNPSVKDNPGALDYWLDFIDTSAEIGKYCVEKIGRRAKVEKTNTAIKTVYNKEIPDIVFNDNEGGFQINPNMLATSSTGSSCYDKIRELLYKHLVYQIQTNITCVPIYHLEPNQIIHIENKEAALYGDFEITQLTIPLAYSGTMSITASEVLNRI